MKSMRRVSSAVGLGVDCSRVATCRGGAVTGDANIALHIMPCVLRHITGHADPYLLVVSAHQVEDEAAICQGQEVTEEEGQAGVEALGQLCILGTQELSVHIHTVLPGYHQGHKATSESCTLALKPWSS